MRQSAAESYWANPGSKLAKPCRVGLAFLSAEIWLMRAVRRTLGKFELCSWTTSRMPLEFCVGLLTFGFQFLASSARALLLLCGSIMAVIEQIFSVLSHVEVSTGSKSSHLPLRRPKAVYVITPLSAKFGA